MPRSTTRARAKRSAPLTIGQRDTLRALAAYLDATTNQHPTDHDAATLHARLREHFPDALATGTGPLFGDEAPATQYDEDWSHEVEFLDFPGRDQLAEAFHPRIMAWVRVKRAPSQPPVIGRDVTWQVNCLYERWRMRVGQIPYGRWVRDMRPALEVFSFVQLWNAIEAFYEARHQYPNSYRFSAFCEGLRDHVTMGAMPYRNAEGDLTTRGARVQALRNERHATPRSTT